MRKAPSSTFSRRGSNSGRRPGSPGLLPASKAPVGTWRVSPARSGDGGGRGLAFSVLPASWELGALPFAQPMGAPTAQASKSDAVGRTAGRA